MGAAIGGISVDKFSRMTIGRCSRDFGASRGICCGGDRDATRAAGKKRGHGRALAAYDEPELSCDYDWRRQRRRSTFRSLTATLRGFTLF